MARKSLAPPQIKPLSRDSLRERIRETLIDRILTGALAPGARINESQLSRALGVSQTPVREALMGLEGQGFLTARPAKGFFVEEFSEKGARDIYRVLADLEAMALEAAGLPSGRTLDELDQINAQLARLAANPQRAIEVDDRFHTRLLAGCPNEYLLRLVGQTRRTAYRYEYVYMGESDPISASSEHHKSIVASLRNGRLEDAVRRLRRAWLASVDDVLRWLAKTKRLDSGSSPCA